MRCPCGQSAIVELLYPTRSVYEFNEHSLGQHCLPCGERRLASLVSVSGRDDFYWLRWAVPRCGLCRCVDPQPRPVKLFGSLAMLHGKQECARCLMAIGEHVHLEVAV